MRVEQKTEIAAPVDVVWAHVHDPSQHTDYMDGFGQWQVSGDQTTGCGARYKLHMQVGSALVGGIVEIVEHQPPHDMAWVSVTGVEHRGRWRLRELGPDRTAVTLRLSYQTPGGLVSVLVDRLSAPFVRRNLRRVLQAVAADVERAGAPAQA
jgi:uncharacterized membrane protein